MALLPNRRLETAKNAPTRALDLSPTQLIEQDQPPPRPLNLHLRPRDHPLVRKDLGGHDRPVLLGRPGRQPLIHDSIHAPGNLPFLLLPLPEPALIVGKVQLELAARPSGSAHSR